MTEELNAKILRQIEFYFSDANLRKDKFMMAQIANDNEGYVPLSILATFKRMQALSDDILAKIAPALEKSSDLELSEDKARVRRKIPFDASEDSAQDDVTAYAFGFPEDATLDDLLAYFDSLSANVAIIRRRYKDSDKAVFSGTAWIQFKTPEDLLKALEMELTYKDAKIKLSPKKNSKEMKGTKKPQIGSRVFDIVFEGDIPENIEELLNATIAGKNAEFKHYEPEKKKIKLKGENIESLLKKFEAPFDVPDFGTFTLKAMEEAESALYIKRRYFKTQVVLNSVIKFKFAEGETSQPIHWKPVKNAFAAIEPVQFVTLKQQNERSGFLQFTKPVADQVVKKCNEEEFKILDIRVNAELLSPEEETEYQITMMIEKQDEELQRAKKPEKGKRGRPQNGGRGNKKQRKN